MRVPQQANGRGSLKWIQLAVNRHQEVLDAPLTAAMGACEAITWVSPLEADEFAEYRDADFLAKVGAADLAPDLAGFWPRQGPQWDALGLTARGDILLVEAKANLPELKSSPTQAGEASKRMIQTAFADTAAGVGVSQRMPWTETYFQLANRLAHLWFLHRHRRQAWLILVNFVGDMDVQGPESAEEWNVAYRVAEEAMGLTKDHALSRYILHLHPHISALR